MGYHPLNKEGDQEGGEQDGQHFFGGLTELPPLTNPFEKHNKSKCSPGNGNGDHVRRISLCDKKDREDETEEKKVVGQDVKICFQRIQRPVSNDPNPSYHSKKRKDRVKGLLKCIE
jgi:hypothetical protein